MKNRNIILAFLLGIFVTVSIAATTTDLMTVKPATPKQTVVLSIHPEIVPEATKGFLKKGYVISKVSCTGTNYYSALLCIVVLEKY